MSQETTQTKSEKSEDETRNALLQLLQLLAREVVKRLKQQQATPEHGEPMKDKMLEGKLPVKTRQNSMNDAH